MSATDTFIATLTQTPQDAQALLTSLNQLNGDLSEIIKVLGYSKTVDDDLAKLDQALTVTIEALEIVSVVPEVGEAAAGLKTAVTALSEEVKPAHKAADEIEAEVKPLRDGLQTIQKYLQDLIDAVAKVQKESTTFLHDFTAVVSCINSLPDGAYKTQGLAYLDSFSAAAQPVVATLNTALVDANRVITEFYGALKAIEQALNPLSAIASAIEDVLSVLQPVTDLLSQLENDLMNIKITVPVPYPVTISLYDIFKDASVFIEEALAPIQDLVNEVLSALNISLPSIPGLSDLLNLTIHIPDIPDFSALLKAIDDALNSLLSLIPKFSLTCPPSGPDAQVPNGGVFEA